MILPNKIFSYSESTISKFPVILTYIKQSPITVWELYKKVKRFVHNTEEFISVLDCLYALNKVNYDYTKGVLTYVDGTDV